MSTSLGPPDPVDAKVKAWFPFWKPRSSARVRLFCFPYAGGSASVLQRWAALGPSVDVIAVQYPGRETRFHEAPLRSISTLVETLGPVMLPLLEQPFAFLGYSMGSLISLLLTYWLRRREAPAPRGLMVAAATPPKVWKPRGTYLLPDEGVIAELQRYGAAPAKVLANRELMELLLPMVRADFEMLDTLGQPAEPPLALPMAVWGGAEDPRPSPRELEVWRDYTTGDFSLQLISGGHFFINSSGGAFLEAVERTLMRWFPELT